MINEIGLQNDSPLYYFVPQFESLTYQICLCNIGTDMRQSNKYYWKRTYHRKPMYCNIIIPSNHVNFSTN